MTYSLVCECNCVTCAGAGGGGQVLQTLSILIANIRSQTNIFYLFSNNYINELITTPFDFDDDEIIGYYINLLKAIR